MPAAAAACRCANTTCSVAETRSQPPGHVCRRSSRRSSKQSTRRWRLATAPAPAPASAPAVAAARRRGRTCATPTPAPGDATCAVTAALPSSRWEMTATAVCSTGAMVSGMPELRPKMGGCGRVVWRARLLAHKDMRAMSTKNENRQRAKKAKDQTSEMKIAEKEVFVCACV